MKVKHIHHNVCYSELEFEIVKFSLASKLWQGEVGMRTGSSLARSKNSTFSSGDMQSEKMLLVAHSVCVHIYFGVLSEIS